MLLQVEHSCHTRQAGSSRAARSSLQMGLTGGGLWTGGSTEGPAECGCSKLQAGKLYSMLLKNGQRVAPDVTVQAVRHAAVNLCAWRATLPLVPAQLRQRNANWPLRTLVAAACSTFPPAVLLQLQAAGSSSMAMISTVCGQHLEGGPDVGGSRWRELLAPHSARCTLIFHNLYASASHSCWLVATWTCPRQLPHYVEA